MHSMLCASCLGSVVHQCDCVKCVAAGRLKDGETGGVAANFKFAVARVGKNGQTLLTLIFISHMLQCC